MLFCSSVGCPGLAALPADRESHGYPKIARAAGERPIAGGRWPHLDGLRGVAVGLVLAYHAWPDRFPGGSVGVDIFFALSGFLITSLLLTEHESTGRIDLRRFWLRRALRLGPALIAYLISVLLLAAIFFDGPGLGNMARFVAATFFYVANFALLDDAPLYYAHTWSLAQEEQFYLFWPLILLAVLPAAHGPRRCFPWLVGAAVVSVVIGAAMLARGAGWQFVYFNPLTHAAPLLAGCALAVVQTTDSGRVARLARLLVVPALAVMCAAVVTARASAEWVYFGPNLLISAAACVLVAAAVALPGHAAVRWLKAPPLRWLGLISYALYLWSTTVIDLLGRSPATRILAIVASLVIATGSYFVVERPLLRRKRTPAQAASRVDEVVRTTS